MTRINIHHFFPMDLHSCQSISSDSNDDQDNIFGFIKSTIASSSDSDDEIIEKKDIPIKYDTYERTVRADVNSEPAIVSLALTQRHHSLWAEFIYNAARVLSDLIDSKKIDVCDMKCVELGAGAGLPSFIAALNGASEVIITDYGHDQDLSLVYAIDLNIAHMRQYIPSEKCYMMGYDYIFGNSIDRLISNSPSKLFDRMFLADLLFNRSEHRKLLWTIQHCLAIDGIAYVTFSHHDPRKRELDLKFFEYAPEYNLQYLQMGFEKRNSYPFVENDGLDEERGYIYIYEMRHINTQPAYHTA